MIAHILTGIFVLIFWIVLWLWMLCLMVYLGCELDNADWDDLTNLGKFVVCIVRFGNPSNKK